MTATQSHPDDGLEPAYAAPCNACDAHFHIFGPVDKYPHVTADLRYQPPSAPLAAYLAIARDEARVRNYLAEQVIEAAGKLPEAAKTAKPVKAFQP